jgi:hypothetical protein
VAPCRGCNFAAADADVTKRTLVKLADAGELGSEAGVSPDKGNKRNQHGLFLFEV